MKLDLYTRDLKTGNRDQQAFESEQAALDFLKSRPKFTEILGVASHHVPAEVNQRLKLANRPLDDEEKQLEAKLEAEAAEAVRKQAEERRKREQEVAAKHREEMKNADPNRQMEIRYRFNAELTLVDQADPREITAEAAEAVKAWVAERNEWVASRGQEVGEAKLQVYPGPLPEGVTERVQSGGTFIPVVAPKKED